jgi:transcription initiation factor IIE alpha subunit
MSMVQCADGHRDVAYDDIGGHGEHLQCPVCEVMMALYENENDSEAAIQELEDRIKELEDK